MSVHRAWILEPRAQARVIVEAELELRRRELGEGTDERDATEAKLLRWARLLELSLLFASVQEAVNALGLATLSDVLQNVPRIDALVGTLARINPDRVIEENADSLGSFPFAPPADAPVSVDIAPVVLAVRSLILHCPIDTLEREGAEAGLAALAHRCRLAFDCLRAFVARNSHPERNAIATAGTAYADARLTVDEVAALLGMTVPDAVALLEEHGFRRSPDDLRMTPEQRAARLREIRAERLARAGRPAADQNWVAREVIASQRIEDIDARPWLRR